MFRQAFGDRMALAAGGDEEIVERPVSPAGPRFGIAHDLAVAVDVNVGAVFFAAPAPAAEADHAVIFRPFGKAVVGRVDGNEAAAIAHVFFEGVLGFHRPGRGFVAEIRDDHAVFGKVRLEVRIRLRLGVILGGADTGEGQESGFLFAVPSELGAGDIHLEEPGFPEVFTHDDRGLRPGRVVVLAIDDEDFEFSGSVGGGCGDEGGSGDEWENSFHDVSVAGAVTMDKPGRAGDSKLPGTDCACFRIRPTVPDV